MTMAVQLRAATLRQVNINTMCELGSGGVSLTSMARRTLGVGGMRAASATYLFLHYALLVACASLHGRQARARGHVHVLWKSSSSSWLSRQLCSCGRMA